MFLHLFYWCIRVCVFFVYLLFSHKVFSSYFIFVSADVDIDVISDEDNDGNRDLFGTCSCLDEF